MSSRLVFTLLVCYIFIAHVSTLKLSLPLRMMSQVNSNLKVPGSAPSSSESKKEKRYKKLLDFVDYKRSSSAATLINLSDDPMIPMVHTVIHAADMRKASFISALRISHITEITTFMIIIEGNSRPQNQVLTYSAYYI